MSSFLTTKAVPSDVYPRSGLRYHSEGMRRNEVSTIPLVGCSRVSSYPRMGVALIGGFRSINRILTQPPAGGSSIGVGLCYEGNRSFASLISLIPSLC